MKKFLLTAALAVFASSAAHAAPSVTPVSPSQLKSAIAKNKGKVVLVNFWATWCGPCVTELPALAKLQRANSKLKVVLVSGDDSDATASVKKTLAAKGHSGSYLIKGDMVDFFEGFDPKFKGAVALPQTYIYDKSGKLVKVVALDHSQAEYQKMIQPYL